MSKFVPEGVADFLNRVHGVTAPVDPNTRRRFLTQVLVGLGLSTGAGAILASCAPAGEIEPIKVPTTPPVDVEPNQVILTRWKEVIGDQLATLFTEKTSTSTETLSTTDKTITRQYRLIECGNTWNTPLVLVTSTTIQDLEHQVYLYPNFEAVTITESPSGKFHLEFPLRPKIVGTNQNASGAYSIDQDSLVDWIINDPAPRQVEIMSMNQLYNSGVFKRNKAAEKLLASVPIFGNFQFVSGSEWYFDIEKKVWQREVEETASLCLSGCN